MFGPRNCSRRRKCHWEGGESRHCSASSGRPASPGGGPNSRATVATVESDSFPLRHRRDRLELVRAVSSAHLDDSAQFGTGAPPRNTSLQEVVLGIPWIGELEGRLCALRGKGPDAPPLVTSHNANCHIVFRPGIVRENLRATSFRCLPTICRVPKGANEGRCSLQLCVKL